MKYTTLVALCAILLAGCASRDKPCDILDTNGGVAQKQAPSQGTEKWDALTGAAIADSDGDATNSNQRVAVDVQSPNQATGPNLTISPLLGAEKQAAQIMTQTLPGESAILRRLAQVENGAEQIRTRLATDAALMDSEKQELSARLDRYEVQADGLIARLDGYAEKKFEAARAIVPDLSGLKTIVYQITTHQTAGNEQPNISDAQAAAIAKVAEAAVTTSQTGGE